MIVAAAYFLCDCCDWFHRRGKAGLGEAAGTFFPGSLQIFHMLEHEDLAKASLLVLANKQDEKTALSAAEISKRLGLLKIKNRRWQIHPCCALTGMFLSYLFSTTKYELWTSECGALSMNFSSFQVRASPRHWIGWPTTSHDFSISQHLGDLCDRFWRPMIRSFLKGVVQANVSKQSLYGASDV